MSRICVALVLLVLGCSVELSVSARSSSARLGYEEALRHYQPIRRLGGSPWLAPKRDAWYLVEARLLHQVRPELLSPGDPGYLFRRSDGQLVLVRSRDSVEQFYEHVPVHVLGKYGGPVQIRGYLRPLRAAVLDSAWMYPVRFGSSPPARVPEAFAPVDDPLGGHEPPVLLPIVPENDLQVETFDPTESAAEWQSRMARKRARERWEWARRSSREY